MDKNDQYDSLMRQVKVIKDRIRGVVHRRTNGLYLYGRPGTSKSHMVCTTLDHLGVRYEFSNGHLTPIGLFELIRDNSKGVIVLDDVSAIFSQPIALQLLLASLGNRHDETGVRHVRYKTARGDQAVPFEGGIIAISNLPLDGHHEEVLGALHDRIFVLHFDPADEQIIALISKLADDGVRSISSANCRKVASFLIAECKTRGVRPTVRLFMDKALRDFELWEADQSETHWKDLIASNLEQQLIELKHPTNDLSRAEQTEAERRIALDVFKGNNGRKERVEAWQQRTGKSQAAYYRRVKELDKAGLLPSEAT